MKITAILGIACIVFAAFACNPSDSELTDNKWSLRSYGEQNNPIKILEGTQITATFDKDKDQISGSSGCNIYSALYEVKGGNLSISEIAHTEMACISPQGVMKQEQDFLSLLASAQSFIVDDTTLTITCSDQKQLLFTEAGN
jgi:heat shock protein HslJ